MDPYAPRSGPLAPVSLSTLCSLSAHLLPDPTSRPRASEHTHPTARKRSVPTSPVSYANFGRLHHLLKRAVEPKSSSVGEDLPDKLKEGPEFHFLS